MVTNGLPLLSTTSPAPSRSPSFTSASDRDVAMDAEEESADDSDFLDADLDDPGDSSISLSITVPALATPKPNIVSTPWPYTSVNQSSPTLPATTPTSRYSMLIIPASSLPHEILLHILRLLPSTSLSPALLVCKAWCQCGVELLWHKPTFTSLPSLSRMLQVISSPDQTFPYPAFVRRLNFSALHGEMTDKTLRRLMPCIWLERLTLAGCKMLGSEGLITLLSQCERLVALDLSDVLAANDAVVETVARCCPKLQGLNLSGCKDVTDRGLEAIARACAGLKRVR
jgi:F-box and leucine-rich repeat protein GRR1